MALAAMLEGAGDVDGEPLEHRAVAALAISPGETAWERHQHGGDYMPCVMA